MIKSSLQSRKKLDTLFHALITDLGNNKSIKECGWIKSKEIENYIRYDRRISAEYLIQTDSKKGVRLDIISQNQDQFFVKKEVIKKINEKFSQYAKQLDYILSLKNEDYLKINISNNVIQKMFKDISGSKGSCNLAVFSGLVHMLENSNLPAPMGDILRANLNPKQWNQISYKSIPFLALQLIQQRDKNASASELLKSFKKLPVKIPENTFIDLSKDSENHVIVENILQWSKIKSHLGKNLIATLGVNWFLVNLLETNKFLPHDQNSTVEVSTLIFDNITILLNINADKIFSDYESFIDYCENEGITWGPEIIAFPEVV